MNGTLALFVSAIVQRDLQTLRHELEAYELESDMWKRPAGITNSAGNLALHLCGNLQHFIGAVLGGSGYKRDREGEFSRTGVPRVALLREIDTTASTVKSTMQGLGAAVLREPYPVEIAGVSLTTADFLIHLAAHLGYHLGQVDYHRRLVTGSTATVTSLAIAALHSARTR